MANEITISVSLAYEDDLKEESISIEDIIKSSSAQKFIRHTQTIAITEEAIVLGEITSPTYCLFRNLDPTNFVELRVATSGAKFARLDPDTNSDGKGGIALLRLGSGAQVPYAIADTAPCEIEYFLIMA